jgi:hypothetical protein
VPQCQTHRLSDFSSQIFQSYIVSSTINAQRISHGFSQAHYHPAFPLMDSRQQELKAFHPVCRLQALQYVLLIFSIRRHLTPHPVSPRRSSRPSNYSPAVSLPLPSAFVSLCSTVADAWSLTLHHTRLHQSVALYFLQRLKARFPAAGLNDSLHACLKDYLRRHLFLHSLPTWAPSIHPPAVSLPSRHCSLLRRCRHIYCSKPWCIVGQGVFALREINQMARAICSYLEWQLDVA